jgi:hypothetical protein
VENDEEMTRKIALHCMKSASESKSELCEECPIYGQTGNDHCFEDALQYVIGMLEQEPKPMVEIDLYSVIKQKYVEREVFDKIRAEIEEVNTYDGVYIDRAYVLEILDKYKAESEDKENE